jgi:hypothetical protein
MNWEEHGHELAHLSAANLSQIDPRKT